MNVTTTHPLDSALCPNDIVVFLGRYVGRCVRIRPDGWVEVRDGVGRIDHYPLSGCTRG